MPLRHNKDQKSVLYNPRSEQRYIMRYPFRFTLLRWMNPGYLSNKRLGDPQSQSEWDTIPVSTSKKIMIIQHTEIVIHHFFHNKKRQADVTSLRESMSGLRQGQQQTYVNISGNHPLHCGSFTVNECMFYVLKKSISLLTHSTNLTRIGYCCSSMQY